MTNFFLSSRSKFLESVKILHSKGINVLKSISGHESQDYTYISLPCNHVEKDKWNLGASSNAPCGHFWDAAAGYLDSKNCILCDVTCIYS